ncbi:hypothetical protein MIT9_P0204 [Methylomarinovum caldicuralii]|uniref:PEP-CTERM protein-sorting domain-containing protein n=1 Tax=Methylomarinovum caldicuralii TaxID=438856 RepID=A0AAU9CCG2_9GAMM|nr:hypothetical protein [Methylomarinovum caldicuralii]BCX80630.1 hypothetical protein MIT9_P0204 [Methylomarinovum caldicuralii]
MKSLKSVIRQGLWATAVVLTSASSWAATVSSSAFIDITSLTVTPQSGSASLSFNPDYSYSLVETDINGSNDFLDGSDPVSLFSDNGSFTEASAYADQEMVVSQTSVGDPSGWADALSIHELEYTASGSGKVLVQVDYDLDLGIIDPAGSIVSAFAFAELLDEDSGNSDSIDIFSTGLPGDPSTAVGSLSILLDVQDGQVGFLQLTALSDSFAERATVPLPATFWLLAPGLGLVLRLGRRAN